MLQLDNHSLVVKITLEKCSEQTKRSLGDIFEKSVFDAVPEYGRR